MCFMCVCIVRGWCLCVVVVRVFCGVNWCARLVGVFVIGVFGVGCVLLGVCCGLWLCWLFFGLFDECLWVW